jgi:hypothetical protein
MPIMVSAPTLVVIYFSNISLQLDYKNKKRAIARFLMLQVVLLDAQREIICSCRNPQGKVNVRPTIHYKYHPNTTS